MDWLEYKVHVNSEAEESVAEIFMNLGSTGISVVNRADFENMPEYGMDTLWALDGTKFPKEGVVVTGYFDPETLAEDFREVLEQRLEALKNVGLNVTEYKIETTNIKDSDWAEKWKEYYHPVPITRYLTIVPEWEAYEKLHPDESLIWLDPGLSFGTGTHPTTQLSIQALEMVLRGDEVVLDVGTGSGVLTIASSILGAAEVYAYDIDETAVSSARSNIALNELDTDITVATNNLLEGIDVQADVVVANILAHIIIQLIPDLANVLQEKGKFIASGIMASQKEQVVKPLEEAGFKILQIHQMDEWLGIIAEKKSIKN